MQINKNKYMTCLGIGIGIGVLLLFVAVFKTISAMEPNVTLRMNETVKKGDIKLTLTGVDDGRCPIGVNCIWAGEVIIFLDVQGRDEYQGKIELRQSSGLEGGVPIAGKELKIKSVTPYPMVDVDYKDSDYVVVLEIR